MKKEKGYFKRTWGGSKK